MNRRLAIGNKLKEARENMRITQQVLAEKLNENPQYISKWENGKMIPPTQLLPEICLHLDISIDDLLDNRRKHIEKSERLIDLGKDVLELVNEKSPKEFYKAYQLINKEQVLVFPTAACQNLLDEIDAELKKELSNLDCEKNYTFVIGILDERRINSKTMKYLGESMSEYILEYSNENSLFRENKISEDLATSSVLYDIVKNFITFWIWVNQMVTYLANDLTENGLKLITEPISDEEFFVNKDYFPKEPGIFLYRILMSRGYTNLIDYKVIDVDEIEELYEYHLNDQRIDAYYCIAKEKFNYINKVKFY
ncbi:helix-turn-helix transcriptional regulator [Enterococcus faecalis]|uniref:helix-turn-helix domain-containing protein n=1 Tax=Enterococcus faecalis TaxID=1351 RepID=UPI001E4CF038|nr:helix-turn-helix transcriptional regulator [Enterococcus faecalis]EHR4852420.1 helix-turn-helix transcriptional regulator [Enterococcus faecalis]EMC0698287.1 helix-turn-helix transcriptional regulator [Enterococcus faecalis]MCD5130300.1 helix-turn-helix transcriptional regulator [Enterococcus faecalis]MDV2557214.1 helix-turn-helix transcriptional regulator [Enterococcus faecalis]MDY2531927.1 helix-turn-helix transcriptional regulator [Enterococcus faecalis]